MTTGQIQAPSAFELWWEKNRRRWTTVAGVAVGGVLLYYGWRYYERSQLDATWSSFASGTNLRKAYAEKNQAMSWALQSPYVRQIPAQMVVGLDEHLAELDDKALDAQIAAAAGTSREPLLLWLSANRAIRKREFDRAKSQLQTLQTKYPTHFLCAQGNYPPQFRTDLNEGKPQESKTTAKPDVKLADPVAGSLVGLALARVEREQKFAAEHAALYKAPEPDSNKVAVVKTDLGEFRIGFYEAAAPKHVATFVDLVNQKHFDKMAIDQITREGEGGFGKPIESLHFGLVSTRDNQDRSKWTEERQKYEGEGLKIIEWENSGVSHFPLVVSADMGKEGKSLAGRINVYLNDASHASDGMQVVFGRVISGEDVLRKIILDSPFTTEEERRAGRGSPRDVITIQSVTIETK